MKFDALFHFSCRIFDQIAWKETLHSWSFSHVLEYKFYVGAVRDKNISLLIWGDFFQVEQILKGNLNSILSPSVKIQIVDGKNLE